MVGIGKENQTMQLFDGPAIFHEPPGEVIEQFGMAGGIAADAKIAGAWSERLAEVMHPQTIDEYTSRQRIVLAGDRLGQLQPAASLLEGLPLIAGQRFEELSRNRGSRTSGIASQQDTRLDWA